jgi:hypothetical protein
MVKAKPDVVDFTICCHDGGYASQAEHGGADMVCERNILVLFLSKTCQYGMLRKNGFNVSNEERPRNSCRAPFPPSAQRIRHDPFRHFIGQTGSKNLGQS